MKKVFFTLFMIVFFSGMPIPGFCQDNKETLAESLSLKQRDFLARWEILSDTEIKISKDLEREVERYNADPSGSTMQNIEELKIGFIENLQDQIRNDRDYISYLESVFSEISGKKFEPIRLDETKAWDSGVPLEYPEAIFMDESRVVFPESPESGSSGDNYTDDGEFSGTLGKDAYDEEESAEAIMREAMWNLKDFRNRKERMGP